MDGQEKFENAKEKLLKCLEAYAEEVKNTPFETVKDLNTKVNLIDTYAQLVKSNMAYRNILNQVVYSKSFGNDFFK